MNEFSEALAVQVRCRVGSSETKPPRCNTSEHVRCRVGSSEMRALKSALVVYVRCRVGSSEIDCLVRTDAR